MSWSWAALMPHPPIIVPEVGYGREKAAAETLKGTERICAEITALNKRAAPEVLLLLSPHESYTPGMLYINSAPAMQGSLLRFGAPKVGSSIRTSEKDLQKLTTELSKAGIPFGSRPQEDITADHASLVPLYFLTPTFEDGLLPPMIVANPCGLSMEKALAMGKMLRGIAGEKRWALLASGDLSHRLKQGAPSGYHPDGQVFDEAIVEALKAGDPGILTGLPPSVLKNAGECGLRPTLVLLGLCQAPLEVFSYEGPFGVGYCNALWSGAPETEQDKVERRESAAPPSPSPADAGNGAPEVLTAHPKAVPSFVKEGDGEKDNSASAAPPSEQENAPAKSAEPAGGGQAAPSHTPGPKPSVRIGKLKRQTKVSGIRLVPHKVEEQQSLPMQAAMLAIKHALKHNGDKHEKISPEPEHPYARLARKSIEAHLLGKTPPDKADIEALSPDPDIWKTQKGCFVSIKNKDGSLRGCIGTFGPTQPDLAAEIMQNSLSAASRDPRFPPMKANELDNVVISVDVLNPPEVLQDDMELDPAYWGVIVSNGMRRGLLLPDLPTVKSVEQQLTIAAQKGGISNLQGAEIRRFSITRHLESKAGEKE